MKNARSHGGRGFSPASTSDIINAPGVFMMIPTPDIKTDTEYQRPLTGARVDRIKENWSWVACGVITVALRGPGSGQYYAIDGQHRVAAAERAGITELPCLVFESVTHVDEAQGFLDVNTSRKAMSVLDRYRALLVVEDPVALKVQGLLRRANRTPLNTSGRAHDDGRGIKCIDYIMQAVTTDEEIIERLWPLIIDICDGKLIVKRLVQGLFYTERFLTNTSLLDRHWRRRLLQVGFDALVKSIDETCSFEGTSRGSGLCGRNSTRRKPGPP